MKFRFLLPIIFIFVTNASAYVDMSAVSIRASELGMNVNDYTFAMAIAGTFTGGIFGLFLWKVK
ncbi:MAG: hypothetical protein FP820_04895 [Sulfurimonas sp.]|nr:hypothetical protein [Sulfurimonas sp.]MBU3939999.1 hypothetical protein [bacterium]MBU4023988.1 hypothetical protein [bacterium]MBU4058584.1 hypothetical protein [bacterium]